MATIRERVLARRDLDAARAGRRLDELTDALNAECIDVLIPSQINLAAILANGVHQEVLIDFMQEAAAGADVSARATALLSDEGVEVLNPGFEPPKVERFDVGVALYNDDGSEK